MPFERYALLLYTFQYLHATLAEFQCDTLGAVPCITGSKVPPAENHSSTGFVEATKRKQEMQKVHLHHTMCASPFGSMRHPVIKQLDVWIRTYRIVN